MLRRRWPRRLALILGGLLLPFLFFEGCVFRTVLPAGQLPDVVYSGGLPRYTAGQRGVYRVRDEIAATYHINNAGWNSGHDHYDRQPPAGTHRIAVIGDSYVEALQVDYDQSFAELLETRLGAPYEVYRFGISGAPLSHYLQMLRLEVVDYQPELVIVNLVHNDFAESYSFRSGVYNSAFLKLDVRDGNVVGEIEPAGYQPPWYAAIRDHSAIWGYFVYRQRLDVTSLRRLFLPAPPPVTAGATEPTASLRAERSSTVYVLMAMKDLADAYGFDLLLLVDADRAAIYRGAGPSPNLQLNEMAVAAADDLDLPIIDLQPIFAADYAQHGRPFDFINDTHWNEYAHAIVAAAVFGYISE